MFDAVLLKHPTLAFFHRVWKTVLFRTIMLITILVIYLSTCLLSVSTPLLLPVDCELSERRNLELDRPEFKFQLINLQALWQPCISHLNWGPSMPGSGRSPGVGNGNPLQYSCLENSVERRAWWATVYAVAESPTWLSYWLCGTHPAFDSCGDGERFKRQPR